MMTTALNLRESLNRTILMTFSQSIPVGLSTFISQRRGLRRAPIHHLKGRLKQQNTFDQCFDSVDEGQRPHVADWLNNKRGLNILYLKYEDMLTDREGTIRKIASFCKINFKESDMPRILERSSFEFMKEHETQFDPRFIMATLYQVYCSLSFFIGLGLNTFFPPVGLDSPF